MVLQVRKIKENKDKTQNMVPVSSPSWRESHWAPAPQTYAVNTTSGPCSGGCLCAGPWGITQYTACERLSSVHLAPPVSPQTQTPGARLSGTGLNSWLPREKLWVLSSLLGWGPWRGGVCPSCPLLCDFPLICPV